MRTTLNIDDDLFQIEPDLISERTREGLVAARANGRVTIAVFMTDSADLRAKLVLGAPNGNAKHQLGKGIVD